MKPRISVVCPTYNITHYLERTLTTILEQTVPPHDVVFSDDGSSDNTVELLRGAENRFSEREIALTVLKNPHCGPGAARNAGIMAAKGEWIAFLDADDVWYPEKIARIEAAIDHSPGANFISHWEEFIKMNGEKQVLRNGSPYDSKGDLAPQIYNANHFSTSAIVCCKELVLKWNGFDNSYPASQDYELWLRLSSDIRLTVVTEILGRYMEMPNSITSRSYHRRFLPLLKILIRHRDKAGPALFLKRSAKVLLSRQWLQYLKA